MNSTPHEEFFEGQAVPTLLSEPGKIFVKKHVKKSKHNPIVEEAELLYANSQYAHMKLLNGQETTVSIKD